MFYKVKNQLMGEAEGEGKILSFSTQRELFSIEV